MYMRLLKILDIEAECAFLQPLMREDVPAEWYNSFIV